MDIERDADAPGPGESAASAEARLRSTREWLVGELRDECSDIGVSARGFDLAGFLRGVRAFARDARRLGAPAERMLVLLKQCLADERLPREDRDVYEQFYDAAVRTAIETYYEATAGAPRAERPEGTGAPRPRDAAPPPPDDDARAGA